MAIVVSVLALTGVDAVKRVANPAVEDARQECCVRACPDTLAVCLRVELGLDRLKIPNRQDGRNPDDPGSLVTTAYQGFGPEYLAESFG